MTATDHSPAETRPAAETRHLPTRLSLVAELVIWNRAWREWRALRRLDADRLSDAGLGTRDRDAITVAAIAARIRG